MKLTSTIISLAALFSFASAAGNVHVLNYNSAYDDPNRQLDTVVCHDYLINLKMGYTTYSSLPAFPYIGGFVTVLSQNSPECGTCWQITHGEKSVNVLAIGKTNDGVDLPRKAMDILINNNGAGAQFPKFPLTTATVTKVENAKCNM